MPENPNYTPGYSRNAVQFMARRTVDTHARFFTHLLRPGMSVLDCGCGPGSITRGLAEVVAPGEVVGLDAGPSQVETARRDNQGVANLRFEVVEGQKIPFPDASFDAVFAHALLEHVPDAGATVREFSRVLRPGGVIGLRSPDWGGFVLGPPDPAVEKALTFYEQLQKANGGDTQVGRKLGLLLELAGLQGIEMDAEYECYADRSLIVDYLALRLEEAGLDDGTIDAFRRWSRVPGGLFAQTWVSATARKGSTAH
ncbi:methyltransferase domain-containing protein [Singulisphaera sp. PoT]|uniref:methyltransferase domain-containing protein n=1 Tax=Singulisphaera sp. PoT TaxID=3411797 RepID=UPI003BF4E53A